MPRILRRWRTASTVLLVVFLGCAAPIGNQVTADEYRVYSDWIAAHFATKPPTALYVRNRTAAFDPLRDPECASRMRKAGVPSALLKELHALGDAEYGLHLDHAKSNLNIPWNFKVLDDWGRLPEPAPTAPYRLLSFSWVAFNRGRTEGLFFYFDSCSGDCGIGGSVFARQAGGRWVFQDAGCLLIATRSSPVIAHSNT